MKKRKMRRRNPVARAVRLIRPKVVPSAKAYSRRPKHKGRSDITYRDGLFLFAFRGTTQETYSAASRCLPMILMISAAAAGMLVPGP